MSEPRGSSASPEKLLPGGDSFSEWPSGPNWGVTRNRRCAMCGGLGVALRYRDAERDWWLCRVHAWGVEEWRAK